jgi:hypothetical protein
MSTVYWHGTALAQWAPVRFVALRWGVGTPPGVWSVFPVGLEADLSTGLVDFWRAAVVDDFGNLVAVPA